MQVHANLSHTLSANIATTKCTSTRILDTIYICDLQRKLVGPLSSELGFVLCLGLCLQVRAKTIHPEVTLQL